MMQPITIRLPQVMMDAIEAEVERRRMEGVDKATIIREWISKGMRSER